MTLAIIRKFGGCEGRLDNYPQKIHLECRMAKKDGWGVLTGSEKLVKLRMQFNQKPFYRNVMQGRRDIQ